MVKQLITEVEAMQILDNALGGLELEARKRMLAWAYAKYGQHQLGGEIDIKKGSEHLRQSDGSLGHIKDFVVRKQPTSLYERVACLAYYLEKTKGVTAFNAKDITQSNTDARQGKIDNVAGVLNDATRKYGFLSQAGNGKKALTAKGEAVAEALPDREKVKAELKKHRGGARKTKRTKK
jgi:hypothetical protein